MKSEELFFFQINFEDVVPFIPVQNASMEDCIDIACVFAGRLAMELNVPVYLYGEAQDREYRRDLSQIRAGEYEALYSKVIKICPFIRLHLFF